MDMFSNCKEKLKVDVYKHMRIWHLPSLTVIWQFEIFSITLRETTDDLE
jgi:hypothetical protein